MSKKIAFSFAVLLLSVSLVACNKEKAVKNGEMSKEANQKGEEVMSVEIKDGETEVKIKGGDSKLADLMESGAKIRCEYEVSEGEDQLSSVIYIDGDKFRTEVDMKEIKAVGIFDGETYYNWTKGEVNQGSKISRRCMEDMQVQGTEETQDEMKDMPFENTDDIVAQEGELKMSCSEVKEINFDIPSDVKFMDTCEMLEKVQNQTQDMEQLQKDMEEMTKGMGL